MKKKLLEPNFKPFHITCKSEDLVGNNGKGVYVLLPGSNGRAKKISTMFDEVLNVFPSERGHNVYVGTIKSKSGKKIDIATVSSGMGCPSVEIIVTELINLGVTTIIRVGTSGLFQVDSNIGDFIVATGGVRDEKTSEHYFPKEFPAVANFELLNSINKTKTRIQDNFPKNRIIFGLTHSKDSLYGREFLYGPKVSQKKNDNYNLLLEDYGVLSSEMEASALFVIGRYYKIRTASVCVGITDHLRKFLANEKFVNDSIKNLCKFSIEIVRDLNK